MFRCLLMESSLIMRQLEFQCVRGGRHAYSRTVGSVSYHYKNPTTRAGQAQSRPHHHLLENELVLAMII
jgi:hypothetical protein